MAKKNQRLERTGRSNSEAVRQDRGQQTTDDGLWFALPQRLLGSISRLYSNDLLTSKQLEGELDLSSSCADHTQVVGSWRSNPIFFYHLQREVMPSAGIDAEFLRELDWDLNQAQVLFRLSVAEERSAWAHEVAKGFIGWLMTTPQFLAEQEELVRLHGKSIAKWGMPSLGRAVMRVTARAKRASVPRGLRAYCDSCETFLLKWRLSELAAPDLPVPLQPMTPVPAPIFAMGPMNTVGGIFYFPDTFPIPSRDVLRGVLDDALRNHPPEHLAAWTALIARGNSAKNQIARFGRLFEIQHYCRILQERHGISADRNLGKLKGALADYFGVSEKAIHADFVLLRKRLGPHWMERATPRL